MRRRVHVEADDVFDLLGESRIIGPLEGADAMWLKAVRFPDALDCAQRQADRLILAIARPVQWVASPDGSPWVNASTWATVAVGTGFLPGGRVLSRSSPSTPASA